ncbi:CinA family nicotinamide mononucleotide deamidase-related protein [Thalassotalea sp. PS06]|uniref:CinA family nicotinamide mononucleotide deamidase-related protein n=1 Tax=Thalassotalea sp. PS06 TaxID=2594005 RepID=UPI0011634B9A|nr:CinA family nicotinamide mononucleotide deamidase-related protein [Thalassotalea sp. PS06]QDP00402.1 CinA family nicotinamide mononucleotide deamidase-related protein [Thalassotalea sp. PS06]
MLKVQLLLTGNELMSGDITDTNSVFMAQQLKNLGVEVHKKVTVGDELELLVNEISALSSSADVLIINGGLGPTVDDLTAQALAQSKGVELSVHPQALQELQAWCDRRQYPLTEPNRKQAILPDGCNIVSNPIGSAPGFSLTLNDCLVICTPGVPREMKMMFEQSILPIIKGKMPAGLSNKTNKLRVFGIGESGLQKIINEQFTDWPEHIDLGFRASQPLLEIKLTAHYQSHHQDLQDWTDKLKTLFAQHIVCEGDGDLPSTVIDILKSQGKFITTAESCTGGLIAASITSVAGSSAVFEAGYTTYSNRIKHQLLGVSEQTLQIHGAVSEPVVRQMLIGALNASGADVGVSVSGIAGPDGGSDEKPVGTVWLAWGDIQTQYAQELYFPGPRRFFQNYIAYAGLDLVRRFLLDYRDTPRYVIERQRKPTT